MPGKYQQWKLQLGWIQCRFLVFWVFWFIISNTNYFLTVKIIMKPRANASLFLSFFMRNHWIQFYDSLLEGEDRCPNLIEKSFAQFAFRIGLYLVIFTINVVLVNILIGQISQTVEQVMQEGHKDYHLILLELKTGFFFITHHISVHYRTIRFWGSFQLCGGSIQLKI